MKYVASSKSQMTDYTKYYVYTGHEAGMVTGFWYFWSGTEWLIGGDYQCGIDDIIETSSSLDEEGMPADSKAVGDMIVVSETEPTSPYTELWIDPDTESVLVPTMDDIEGTYAKKSEVESTYARKAAVGSPLRAATASAMTDVTKIYVYTGSETGYTAGDWYYYDGAAWTDGGVYNSTAFVTDKTLTGDGEAADAKVTGDRIGELENATNNVKIPELRNGSVGNPSNVYAVTSKYVIPIDKNYSKIKFEFLGGGLSSYKYAMNYCLFRGTTDGTSTSDAYSDTSIKRRNVDNTEGGGLTTEPLTILDISNFDAYDHISFSVFRYSGNELVPIRVDSGNYIKITFLDQQDLSDLQKSFDLLTKEEKLYVPYKRIFDMGFDTGTGETPYEFQWDITNFIPVISGETIHISNSVSTIYNGFYESDKTFVGSFTVPASDDFKCTVPINASYMVLTNRHTTFDFEIWREATNIGVNNNKNNEIIHKTKNSRHVKSNGYPKYLTILHFSDIHGDFNALNRIMSDVNRFEDNIDEVICTGDMVSNTGGSISSWWDENVLTCIGNHDSATYNSTDGYNWVALSMDDRDNYYIAPFESNWEVTHVSGTSYYYKDYNDAKVRLIVMDAMLYSVYESDTSLGEAQNTWLSNLLNDAITNQLHVVIAIHSAHDGSPVLNCSFSKYNETAMPLWTDCNTPQSIIDIVKSKIINGLKFIGYLCGHTHQDNVWDADNNGEQLMYCVTCANSIEPAQWVDSDQDRSDNSDAYNIVTIDTTNTLVKIVRGGGADLDDHLRTRKAICINYSTGVVEGEIL